MKCSFCSTNIEKGTGKIFIHSTGKISYYCSRKCEKNQLKLGRDPRNFKWASEKVARPK